MEPNYLSWHKKVFEETKIDQVNCKWFEIPTYILQPDVFDNLRNFKLRIV